MKTYGLVAVVTGFAMMLLAGCAGPQQTVQTEGAEPVEPDHAWCVMTRFDIPAAEPGQAPDPACTLEDPKTGNQYNNPRAMHLDVHVSWKVTDKYGEEKLLDMPGMSTNFCLTRDRLFVEACDRDGRLKKNLPLAHPFDEFSAQFASAPFVGVASRTISEHIFEAPIPSLTYPLTVTWPVDIGYPKHEQAPGGQYDRLTSGVLQIQRANYLLVTAVNAKDELEPVKAIIEAKVPKQGGGYDTKVINPAGEFALALANPVPGTIYLIKRDGFESADVQVNEDLSISGNPEMLLEKIVLNTYETFYLVRLNQAVVRPRRDPRMGR